MKNLLCSILGHVRHSHLDYIYGSLPREHIKCKRCYKTLSLEMPSKDRERELIALGDIRNIRDGDVRGCKPM